MYRLVRKSSMSKIGRKPIQLHDVTIEIEGQEISFKGPHAAGKHMLPDFLKAEKNDNELQLSLLGTNGSKKKFWGLHRSLLANKILGAHKPFEKELMIVGLGYKAVRSGNTLTFSLGFSHKIDYELPENITLEIDKTGQRLVFKSPDKELVGHVCSQIRAMRPPEPYKGTGIRLSTEQIIRKAGKTKA